MHDAIKKRKGFDMKLTTRILAILGIILIFVLIQTQVNAQSYNSDIIYYNDDDSYYDNEYAYDDEPLLYADYDYRIFIYRPEFIAFAYRRHHSFISVNIDFGQLFWRPRPIVYYRPVPYRYVVVDPYDYYAFPVVAYAPYRHPRFFNPYWRTGFSVYYNPGHYKHHNNHHYAYDDRYYDSDRGHENNYENRKRDWDHHDRYIKRNKRDHTLNNRVAVVDKPTKSRDKTIPRTVKRETKNGYASTDSPNETIRRVSKRKTNRERKISANDYRRTSIANRTTTVDSRAVNRDKTATRQKNSRALDTNRQKSANRRLATNSSLDRQSSRTNQETNIRKRNSSRTRQKVSTKTAYNAKQQIRKERNSQSRTVRSNNHRVTSKKYVVKGKTSRGDSKSKNVRNTHTKSAQKGTRSSSVFQKKNPSKKIATPAKSRNNRQRRSATR